MIPERALTDGPGPPAWEDAGASPGGAGRVRRRGWTFAAVALAVATAAGIAAYSLTPKPSSVIAGSTGSPGAGLPRLAAGRSAPEFSLPRLGGGPPVSLSADKGHPVVLNFFASWCSDCRAELGAFAQVSNHPHGTVRFLAVDTNDTDTAKARSLLAHAGDRYPVGVDADAAVANGSYLVEALPVTVYISASGHIVGESFGTQTARSLTAWTHALARNRPTSGPNK